MKLSLSGIFLAILVHSAEAETSACQAIADDTERLACFDAQFDQGTSKAPTNDDRWVTESETSAMTDQKTAWTYVASDNAVQCNGYGAAQHINLMFACFENSTSIQIGNEGCFFGSGPTYGQVTYRIDDRPAKTLRMTASTENSSIGLWGGKKSIPVIKDMLSGEKLRIRLTPVNQTYLEVEFTLAGADEAIKAVREACGW